jgi:hypothetical protein
MDVLTLVLACSVFPDDALVRAMVDLASRGNPHFVGDTTTLATFDQTNSSADADRIVQELERQGGRPVVGLLAVPPAWAQRYGRARAELYDACVNLWVGTAVLAGHYEACVAAHAAKMTATAPGKSRDGQRRIAPPEAIRLCALRRYGTDIGVDGYAEAVMRLMPEQRLLFTPARLAPVRADANMCSCNEDLRACPDPLISRPLKARRKLPAGMRQAPILD